MPEYNNVRAEHRTLGLHVCSMKYTNVIIIHAEVFCSKSVVKATEQTANAFVSGRWCPINVALARNNLMLYDHPSVASDRSSGIRNRI